jgi:hypothetical protein
MNYVPVEDTFVCLDIEFKFLTFLRDEKHGGALAPSVAGFEVHVWTDTRHVGDNHARSGNAILDPLQDVTRKYVAVAPFAEATRLVHRFTDAEFKDVHHHFVIHVLDVMRKNRES